MSLARLSNVTKQFDTQPILDGIDFRVEEGEKVGLIGRNGTGKSTLFRLILGQQEPTSGVVETMRRARIACLAQLPQLSSHDTIHDIVMHSFSDMIKMEKELEQLGHCLADADDKLLQEYAALQEQFEHRGGYDYHFRIDQVLQGLGFDKAEYSLPVTVLSGGQRTRLMLALVLLEDADLLLLDEPENHLDLAAREWLESFVKDSPHAFVIISHDRRMLNAVTERIVEIERGKLRSYTGNYDAYIARKNLEQEQQRKAFSRQQRQIEEEERWIERFRYKSSKARQVQSRIKRLDRMERIDVPTSEQSRVKLRLSEASRASNCVLEAEHITVQYGDLTLYRSVDLRMERGDRIGVLGPNGCGKSTLLRHLAGRLDIAEGNISGTVHPGRNIHIGFYDQHHDSLNRGNDILTEIRIMRPDLTPEQVRSFMGHLLFTGDDIYKGIDCLSGGELSRVALAKLILGDANVLFLDEPTNHLDIASREVLEESLLAFEGTMILVSHDRALLDKLVTKLLVFEADRLRIHLGNYSDYKISSVSTSLGLDAENDPDVMRIRNKKDQKIRNRDEQKQRDREERRRRRELDGLEEQIASLEQLVQDHESDFASLNPEDHVRILEMKREYDGLKADLQELYSAWEALVSEMI